MVNHLPLDQDAIVLSHLGIFVNDLELMGGFYQDVLDFKKTDEGDLGHTKLLFLSRDPREHHQIVLASGKPEALPFNPINQISFRVPHLGYLKEFHQRVQNHAFTKDLVSICHGNAISIYFRDPEGNRIEIFLDTPWYCEQPLREEIDLSKPDAQIMEQARACAKSRPGFCTREVWLAKMQQLMNFKGGSQ